jgi:hypothetical protein
VDFSVTDELPPSDDDAATGFSKPCKLTPGFAKGTLAFWVWRE